MRPFEFLETIYPAPSAFVFCGSSGIAVTYLPPAVRTERSTRPVHDVVATDEEQISVGTSVIPDGRIPLLSTEYCVIALRIVLTAEFLEALRVSPSCLAGLIATITIPARIAIAATTRRISISVNPFWLRSIFFIKYIEYNFGVLETN
jgi:hypothetical protein